MNRQYYDLLGVSESATDEEISARYEQLKRKYSEERFLEGEAGNEAAKMLNRIDVAYTEIMSARQERRTAENAGSSYARVEQLIREGKIAEAQSALDEFNERPAEWHYLQSVVFYRKNWINESKKQLEIAMQLEPSNEKYSSSYNRLRDKIEYDRRQAENPAQQQRAGQGAPADDYDQQQMGGSFCEQCATCCACNVLFNICLNACCGCR